MKVDYYERGVGLTVHSPISAEVLGAMLARSGLSDCDIRQAVKRLDAGEHVRVNYTVFSREMDTEKFVTSVPFSEKYNCDKGGG